MFSYFAIVLSMHALLIVNDAKFVGDLKTGLLNHSVMQDDKFFCFRTFVFCNTS